MYDINAALKAEERVQVIKVMEATAARIIITAYNDLEGINRPGLPKEKIISGCIDSLNTATIKLNKALKLYCSESTPELKTFLTSRFEQLHCNNHYLECIQPHHAQGDSDEE